MMHSFVKGFILGFACGLAAGFFLAPGKGEENLTLLQQRLQQAREASKEARAEHEALLLSQYRKGTSLPDKD
jgi:gas vesicle protein